MERAPAVPEGLDLRQLPRGVRAELRGLPKELSEKVGAHLLAAGTLIDEDPECAYAHAKAARRLAARLPVVREAVAETAYAAQDYAAALAEYRALRRMSGNDDFLPVMADCERALGRSREALELVREAERLDLNPASAVELRIVEAGARADQGQRDEAMRLLRREIEASKQQHGLVDGPRARLRYAYADLLLAAGDEPAAREWFAAAARLDKDAETDASDRLADLDGLVIVLDADDAEDEGAQDEDDEND